MSNDRILRGEQIWNKVFGFFFGKPSLNVLAQNYDVNYGGNIRIAPNGTQEVGELVRLVGGNFESGVLSPTVWFTQVLNGGTVSAVTGEGVLSTNGQVNGEARIQSTRRSRFVTGTFNKTHQAVQYFPAWDAPDCDREFGFYDPINPILTGDGVFLRNNSGVFSIVRRKAGVEVESVPEANFNGVTITGNDASVLVKDNNVHIYEFQYNAGRIDLIQDGKLIHRMASLNSVAYETVHLPVGAVCRNINGNNAVNELKTRGFSCSRIGSNTARPDRFRIGATQAGTIKNSPGTLHRILVPDIGNGQASITFWDSPNAAGAIPANQIFAIDVTENLVQLDCGFDFDKGLYYSAQGSGIEILVIYD